MVVQCVSISQLSMHCAPFSFCAAPFQLAASLAFLLHLLSQSGSPFLDPCQDPWQAHLEEPFLRHSLLWQDLAKLPADSVLIATLHRLLASVWELHHMEHLVGFLPDAAPIDHCLHHHPALLLGNNESSQGSGVVRRDFRSQGPRRQDAENMRQNGGRPLSFGKDPLRNARSEDPDWWMSKSRPTKEGLTTDQPGSQIDGRNSQPTNQDLALSTL